MSPTYEVRCYNCDVSFPPEVKRCLHCGARTSSEPPPGVRIAQMLAAGEAGGMQEVEPADGTEVLEEEVQGASPFRFGSTGLWIALALGAGIMRACFGS